ncbi:hypothetical protein ASD38_04860 [Caulobacter sp. Root487D2Y]|uniref:YDG domain-containing protein n=1 Tax=Caulobacter sp. Root487D2Y TaxID=1736547 RepID=UPI0006F86FB7|nr:YDG domain-containing protein [Caulobacter sp. Root487D2Y]KQY35877.1 hypothetical protein ASD38_04860 [Caulobacter sp. Root487D2Y]
MTPSQTRSILPRTAPRSARRTRLLAASALCGVATLLAQPALAQTLPGIPGGGSITVSTGGSAPVITAPNANTLDIDLNAPRTVINWSSLHVSGADEMDFHFDAASDIVLNKTTTQIAIDSGAVVTGKVGASTGGNIWFYSPQGVIVSPGATMTAGGFLFSRGSAIVDATFVDAADPLANLRAATDALIRITTISTATSASIDASGNVLLSASSGGLNVAIAEGATVGVSTTSGSITVSEATAATGAASVTAGGPGATVTAITGATGVTVSSGSNTSVGSATTTTSGDIVLGSGGSVSLTLGNSARDTLLTAPIIFLSTLDAGRDAILTGDTGVTVTNRIFAGDDIELTASNGDITAGGAFLKSTGLGAGDDAHILLRSDTGAVTATNTLQTQGTGARAGDVTVQAATTASAGATTATRDVKVTGVTASLTNGSAARDLFVTATTGGATVTTAATAGDDVEVTATTGAVLASGATLRSTGVGATDDAHVLARSTGGAVNVGTAQSQGAGAAVGDITIDAATTATLGTGSSTRDLFLADATGLTLTGNYGAAGTVSLTASAGGIVQSGGVITADILTAQSDGGFSATRANLVNKLGSVQDSASADVAFSNAQALSITDTVSGGGDIDITTTAGVLTLAANAQVIGQGDVTLTGDGGFTAIPSVSGTLQGSNVIVTAMTGDALVDHVFVTGGGGAALVQALAGSATLRNVLVDGAVDQIQVVATGTATLGADSQAGIVAHNSVDRLSGSLTYLVVSLDGDARVFLDSLDADLGSVSANTATGTASVGVADGFTVDAVGGHNVFLSAGNGVIAANTVTVGGGDYTAEAQDWGGNVLAPAGVIRDLSIIDTAGGLALTNALTATGDLSLSSAGVLGAADALVAGGDIDVTATEDIDLVSAEAGDDITVTATGGGAILRKAVLTGAGTGRDLAIAALDDAVLGDPLFSAITADNTFSRTGGSTGAATVISASGDALVHLDTSAKLDTLEGAGVDVTIASGAAVIDTLTALTDDIYVETLDGALTVGAATANTGDVELFADGGDLTITGSAHGDGLVRIGTDGLLDGTLASLISSNGDLDLEGGAVDVGSLQADGVITATADTGNIDVQSALAGVGISIGGFGDAFVGTAEADQGVFVVAGGDALVNFAKANDPAGFVIVHGDGDATLRAAEAPDGVLVDAVNKATFGADDAASVTAANYVVTDPTCGCGAGGLQVVSSDGDAVVNINSASNGVTLVAAAVDGDATVFQKTGDLKIEELAAFNITLEAMAGTLETGSTTVSGGDYTITAHDFLGDALTPILFSGAIRDVAVTDTLGDLDLGSAAIHADRKLTIVASNGAVTGAGQLDAGIGAHDGAVDVTADAISLDAVVSDGDVNLTAATGGVSLGTGGGHADHLLHITALNGAVTSLGQLDAGQGAGAHDGEVNVAANAMTLDAVRSDGDVSLSAGSGGVSLGGVVHADNLLAVTALNGAVTGAGQLDAGDVEVTADAIALDTVLSGGDLDLEAGTGLVNVATSVTVGDAYALTGGDFSAAALAPLGAKAGAWTILDQAGDFDFSGKTLRHGGSIGVTVTSGDILGGDMTSDLGGISVAARGGHLGALYGGGGAITATASVGGMAVDSADALADVTVLGAAGTASLGSAVVRGSGARTLTVVSNSDVVLGAATSGAITAGNVFTSTGGSLAIVASAPTGKVDVNLDHTTNAGLNTVFGLNGVKIKVVNGSHQIGFAGSTNGGVQIDGPTDALTVYALTAGAASRVNGGGDTQLVSADVTGDLAVTSASGNLRLGDATLGGVIDVRDVLSLNAATDIAQHAALHAGVLEVTAGTGAVLLGANQISYLDAVTVGAGGFAFNSTTGYDLYGAVNAVGQTVDLRSDGAIGQVSTGIITAQKLTGWATGGATFGAANQVVQLGDFTNTGGLLKLIDGRSLTVVGTVWSTGTVSLTSHAGMTFAGTGRVQADGTGDAAMLASDGVFTNARGADAVTAANGRWLIYTQAVGAPLGSTAGNTFNGLAGKSFYGSAYDFSNETFATPVNAGNRFVYAYQPTLTVTPDSRTVIYDGTIPTTSATIAGLVNGDLAADAWSGAPTVSGATSKVVGTYILTAAAGGLASDLNYAFGYGTGSLRIDPKALTAVLTANTRTYDGTTAATGSIGLTGVVAGDAVGASGTYAFADKTAGTGKTVTASGMALSGADAGNYTLTSTAAGTADILKKDLTGALTADTKTYDGTVAATGSIGLTGVVAGDAVSASGSYAFADKNVGTGKTVTASGSVLAGADAGNYSLTSVSAALADILRRQVSVAANSLFKPFGQVEPTLTYRVTVGDLAAGDAFTGALGREVGEIPGSYAITRGTLALSANYDLTFTGAVFTIRPLPSNEAGGMPALRHLTQAPDFILDWDPESHLTTEGEGCLGEGCPPQGAMSGGGKVVAALR